MSRGKILKFISVATTLCFVVTDLVFAVPGGITLLPQKETPDFFQVEIPEDLASIEEIYEAPPQENPRLVLHVQNIHGNYEAQVQIKNLLDFLHKQYGFNLLFAEGAIQKLDPDYLRMMQDEEWNREFVDDLAKQGKVTGIEYFLVNGPEDVEAYGIEDPELYRLNYESFKKVYSVKAETTRFISQFESRLESISSNMLPQETRRVLGEWRKFQAGRREFLPYVQRLARDAKRIISLDLESIFAQVEWPQITRLLVLQAMEKDMQPEVAEAEKKRLIDFLQEKRISPEIIKAIGKIGEKRITMSRSEQARRLEDVPRYLFERLVEEATPRGFRFHDYPAFSLWAGYLILKSELDSKPLFEEINRVFEKVLDELAINETEKNLLELYRDHELLQKLFALEVTRKEWDRALYRREWIQPSVMTRRLRKLAQEKRLPQMPLDKGFNPLTFKQVFESAFEFYRLARERETAFYESIDREMTRTQKEKAVLVTGGFHTDGIMDLFREKQVNYSVLMPKLSRQIETENYVENMLETKPTMFDLATLEMILYGQDRPSHNTQSPNKGKGIVRGLVQSSLEFYLNKFQATGDARATAAEVSQHLNEETVIGKRNYADLVPAELAPSENEPTARVGIYTEDSKPVSRTNNGVTEYLAVPVRPVTAANGNRGDVYRPNADWVRADRVNFSTDSQPRSTPPTVPPSTKPQLAPTEVPEKKPARIPRKPKRRDPTPSPPEPKEKPARRPSKPREPATVPAAISQEDQVSRSDSRTAELIEQATFSSDASAREQAIDELSRLGPEIFPTLMAWFSLKKAELLMRVEKHLDFLFQYESSRIPGSGFIQAALERKKVIKQVSFLHGYPARSIQAEKWDQLMFANTGWLYRNPLVSIFLAVSALFAFYYGPMLLSYGLLGASVALILMPKLHPELKKALSEQDLIYAALSQIAQRNLDFAKYVSDEQSPSLAAVDKDQILKGAKLSILSQGILQGVPIDDLVSLGGKLIANGEELGRYRQPIQAESPGVNASDQLAQKVLDKIKGALSSGAISEEDLISMRLQLAIGFNLGDGKYRQRARFNNIPFFFAIGHSEGQYQPITAIPEEEVDPHAAYGTLIGGYVISPRQFWQRDRQRHDHVIKIQPDITLDQLKGIISIGENLSLGLLVTTAADQWEDLNGEDAKLPNSTPEKEKIIRIYRRYERELIKLLRQYNQYRDPEMLNEGFQKLHPDLVQGWTNAMQNHGLEESLEPQHQFLTDLNQIDQRLREKDPARYDPGWNKLFPFMTGIDAMILNDWGIERNGRETTVGQAFVIDLAELAAAAANDIRKVRRGEKVSNLPEDEVESKDPFIDSKDLDATTGYAERVAGAVLSGNLNPMHVIDPEAIINYAPEYLTDDLRRVFNRSDARREETVSRSDSRVEAAFQGLGFSMEAMRLREFENPAEPEVAQVLPLELWEGLPFFIGLPIQWIANIYAQRQARLAYEEAKKVYEQQLQEVEQAREQETTRRRSLRRTLDLKYRELTSEQQSTEVRKAYALAVEYLGVEATGSEASLLESAYEGIGVNRAEFLQALSENPQGALETLQAAYERSLRAHYESQPYDRGREFTETRDRIYSAWMDWIIPDVRSYLLEKETDGETAWQPEAFATRLENNILRGEKRNLRLGMASDLELVFRRNDLDNWSWWNRNEESYDAFIDLLRSEPEDAEAALEVFSAMNDRLTEVEVYYEVSEDSRDTFLILSNGLEDEGLDLAEPVPTMELQIPLWKRYGHSSVVETVQKTVELLRSIAEDYSDDLPILVTKAEALAREIEAAFQAQDNDRLNEKLYEADRLFEVELIYYISGFWENRDYRELVRRVLNDPAPISDHDFVSIIVYNNIDNRLREDNLVGLPAEVNRSDARREVVSRADARVEAIIADFQSADGATQQRAVQNMKTLPPELMAELRKELIARGIVSPLMDPEVRKIYLQLDAMRNLLSTIAIIGLGLAALIAIVFQILGLNLVPALNIIPLIPAWKGLSGSQPGTQPLNLNRDLPSDPPIARTEAREEVAKEAFERLGFSMAAVDGTEGERRRAMRRTLDLKYQELREHQLTMIRRLEELINADEEATRAARIQLQQLENAYGSAKAYLQQESQGTEESLLAEAYAAIGIDRAELLETLQSNWLQATRQLEAAYEQSLRTLHEGQPNARGQAFREARNQLYETWVNWIVPDVMSYEPPREEEGDPSDWDGGAFAASSSRDVLREEKQALRNELAVALQGLELNEREEVSAGRQLRETLALFRADADESVADTPESEGLRRVFIMSTRNVAQASDFVYSQRNRPFIIGATAQPIQEAAMESLNTILELPARAGEFQLAGISDPIDDGQMSNAGTLEPIIQTSNADFLLSHLRWIQGEPVQVGRTLLEEMRTLLELESNDLLPDLLLRTAILIDAIENALEEADEPMVKTLFEQALRLVRIHTVYSNLVIDGVQSGPYLELLRHILDGLGPISDQDAQSIQRFEALRRKLFRFTLGRSESRATSEPKVSPYFNKAAAGEDFARVILAGIEDDGQRAEAEKNRGAWLPNGESFDPQKMPPTKDTYNAPRGLAKDWTTVTTQFDDLPLVQLKGKLLTQGLELTGKEERAGGEWSDEEGKAAKVLAMVGTRNGQDYPMFIKLWKGSKPLDAEVTLMSNYDLLGFGPEMLGRVVVTDDENNDWYGVAFQLLAGQTSDDFGLIPEDKRAGYRELDMVFLGALMDLRIDGATQVITRAGGYGFIDIPANLRYAVGIGEGFDTAMAAYEDDIKAALRKLGLPEYQTESRSESREDVSRRTFVKTATATAALAVLSEVFPSLARAAEKPKRSLATLEGVNIRALDVEQLNALLKEVALHYARIVRKPKEVVGRITEDRRPRIRSIARLTKAILERSRVLMRDFHKTKEVQDAIAEMKKWVPPAKSPKAFRERRKKNFVYQKNARQILNLYELMIVQHRALHKKGLALLSAVIPTAQQYAAEEAKLLEGVDLVVTEKTDKKEIAQIYRKRSKIASQLDGFTLTIEDAGSEILRNATWGQAKNETDVLASFRENIYVPYLLQSLGKKTDRSDSEPKDVERYASELKGLYKKVIAEDHDFMIGIRKTIAQGVRADFIDLERVSNDSGLLRYLKARGLITTTNRQKILNEAQIKKSQEKSVKETDKAIYQQKVQNLKGVIESLKLEIDSKEREIRPKGKEPVGLERAAGIARAKFVKGKIAESEYIAARDALEKAEKEKKALVEKRKAKLEELSKLVDKREKQKLVESEETDRRASLKRYYEGLVTLRLKAILARISRSESRALKGAEVYEIYAPGRLDPLRATPAQLLKIGNEVAPGNGKAFRELFTRLLTLSAGRVGWFGSGDEAMPDFIQQKLRERPGFDPLTQTVLIFDFHQSEVLENESLELGITTNRYLYLFFDKEGKLAFYSMNANSDATGVRFSSVKYKERVAKKPSRDDEVRKAWEPVTAFVKAQERAAGNKTGVTTEDVFLLRGPNGKILFIRGREEETRLEVSVPATSDAAQLLIGGEDAVLNALKSGPHVLSTNAASPKAIQNAGFILPAGTQISQLPYLFEYLTQGDIAFGKTSVREGRITDSLRYTRGPVVTKVAVSWKDLGAEVEDRKEVVDAATFALGELAFRELIDTDGKGGQVRVFYYIEAFPPTAQKGKKTKASEPDVIMAPNDLRLPAKGFPGSSEPLDFMRRQGRSFIAQISKILNAQNAEALKRKRDKISNLPYISIGQGRSSHEAFFKETPEGLVLVGIFHKDELKPGSRVMNYLVGISAASPTDIPLEEKGVSDQTLLEQLNIVISRAEGRVEDSSVALSEVVSAVKNRIEDQLPESDIQAPFRQPDPEWVDDNSQAWPMALKVTGGFTFGILFLIDEETSAEEYAALLATYITVTSQVGLTDAFLKVLDILETSEHLTRNEAQGALQLIVDEKPSELFLRSLAVFLMTQVNQQIHVIWNMGDVDAGEAFKANMELEGLLEELRGIQDADGKEIGKRFEVTATTNADFDSTVRKSTNEMFATARTQKQISNIEFYERLAQVVVGKQRQSVSGVVDEVRDSSQGTILFAVIETENAYGVKVAVVSVGIDVSQEADEIDEENNRMLNKQQSGVFEVRVNDALGILIDSLQRTMQNALQSLQSA